MSKTAAPFVVDVNACDDCIFFSDTDRNGAICGAPNSAGVRLRWAKRGESRVIVDKSGDRCPLLVQDVLVRRST